MMSAISRHILQPLLVIAAVVLANTCTPARQVAVQVDGGKIRIEFDDHLHSRVISTLGEEPVVLGDMTPSEFITVDGKAHRDFQLSEHTVTEGEDEISKKKVYHIKASSPLLNKEVTITSYDDFPAMLALQVTYTNMGDADLVVNSWTNHNYAIAAAARSGDTPTFWSYQGGSYGWGNDWIKPLEKGFAQENYMGMNHVDYGGGTPVVDVWRQDVGLAVGHLEMVPRLVSLPVAMPNARQATVEINYQKPKTLKPGESFTTFRTFVSVHEGDHFQTLSDYGRIMVRKGIEFKEPPAGAYETIWCAWGYEKNFTMEQFYNTFPKVKDLGLKWVVLDYGWEIAEGDFELDKTKFPNGDASMRKVVADIHAIGAKAKLWWMPLSAEPHSQLLKDHPEYLLLNEDGSTRDIKFWKSYFLCPASPAVWEHTRQQVITMMKTWGWDGLKIDGNNLNGVPPCYNPAHNHAYPEESVEQLPAFHKMVYETALSINPDAVIEICPCGTNYSFFILPYMNQAVASDPENSWMIRQKGKTIKALSGSKVAFYGDHVELSDGKEDFATTVGIGGVIGTKFTWPAGVYISEESGDIGLTSEKEAKWAKWIKIYEDKMLPLGTYRGDLYDIGFYRPETHAIEKGDARYYAFYADKYDGQVELRGLDSRTYRLVDYVNGKDFGTVTGPTAKVEAAFNQYLLLEAVPE